MVEYNPFDEVINVHPISDETEREKAKTIGYYAMFELVNGFRKTLYWSKDKMENHAMKYSQGYKAKKGYTFWEKDFDGMAYKTMIRQLISKWGIMSIELQNAFENDYTFKDESGVSTYVEEGNENVNYANVTEDIEVTEVTEENNITEAIPDQHGAEQQIQLL